MEDEVDTCGSRKLGLEVIIAVSLRRDENNLWQHSRDREEEMGFQRETNMLVIVCLGVEDQGGDG